jgi:ribosomal protein L11 methyltransferase
VIRLAVRVSRAHAADALAELLAFSPAGVEEVDAGGGTVEYVLYGASGELPDLPALQATVGDALVDVATREIGDDWQSRWRSFHRPVDVASVLRVRAPWHEAPAAGGPIDIVIEPAQAFGTGAHATTRGCLELLVALVLAGEGGGSLLDLGTGSGVLAIAAAKLGFAPVTAVDNELESVAAARANGEANGVELDVRRLDLLRDPLPAADTVAANLLRPLLLALAARPAQLPARLVASGLLREEADEVAAAFAAARHPFAERARLHDGGWATLLLERR